MKTECLEHQILDNNSKVSYLQQTDASIRLKQFDEADCCTEEQCRIFLEQGADMKENGEHKDLELGYPVIVFEDNQLILQRTDPSICIPPGIDDMMGQLQSDVDKAQIFQHFSEGRDRLIEMLLSRTETYVGEIGFNDNLPDEYRMRIKTIRATNIGAASVWKHVPETPDVLCTTD